MTFNKFSLTDDELADEDLSIHVSCDGVSDMFISFNMSLLYDYEFIQVINTYELIGV